MRGRIKLHKYCVLFFDVAGFVVVVVVATQECMKKAHKKVK